jgi:hypothetical protein
VLFNQDVQAWRQGSRQLPAVQTDRVGVLLATEDELRFLFALCGLLPNRHGDRHHDGHHAEGDQKSSHRVSALVSTGYKATVYRFAHHYTQWRPTFSRERLDGVTAWSYDV